ncbi:leucine-rich repeat domain-containing protein [Pseudooceanicola sp.]|uniref:leucine-rich repeat domain-containing protein n=1 Tax=Pseudooceanicola sp. TaxID=1914328 RepID=UPI0035C76B70
MTAAEEAYERAKRAIEEAAETGATNLSFDRQEFFDLEAIPPEIGELTALRSLRLDDTQVSDIGPIRGLTALESLTLDNTQVFDIDPVRQMSSLAYLGLSNTQVSDINPIRALTALAILTLDQTPIFDIDPIRGLTALEALYLDNTQVSDIDPIRNLISLRSLFLSMTQVSDLDPLRGLTKLETLTFRISQVSDIEPIRGLTALEYLALDNTQVSDIDPIRGLTALEYLDLDNTPVSDLRPLKGIVRLADAPDHGGLTFKGIAATRHDPKLAEIAEIEDNAERARTLFGYLKDWEPPKSGNFDPDPLAPVDLIDDRLEVARSSPAEAEREEQLKQVLHERLRTNAAALSQAAGNRFFRLAARSRSLVTQVDRDFADLDMLTLHLAVEDLRAMARLGKEEEDGEGFPPEVIVPLEDVIKDGPGLTLGNDAVDLLVERINRQRGEPPPEDAPEQEDLSTVISKGGPAIGPNLQAVEETVAEGRTAEAREVRKAVNRNVLWRIATVVRVLAKQPVVRTSAKQVGFVAGAAVSSQELAPPIWQFILTNWDLLHTVGMLYGAEFYQWFAGALADLGQAKGLSAPRREGRDESNS